AVSRTRGVIRQQRRIVAFAIVLTLLPLSFTIGAEGVRFLLRDEPRTAVFWLPAASLWFTYLRMQRRLKTAGLGTHGRSRDFGWLPRFVTRFGQLVVFPIFFPG